MREAGKPLGAAGGGRGDGCRTRPALRVGLMIALAVCWLLPATSCPAKPTQADFFKGMQDEVSDSGDRSSKETLPWVVGAAAVVMLLSLMSLRQKKREAKPKAINHPGKLLKEITKRVALRPVELKQLRLLAENPSEKDAAIDNPLVMLLCPSLLAKSLKKPPARIDRKAIASLARKLGLVIAKAKK